jgi:general secretion pathway protein L
VSETLILLLGHSPDEPVHWAFIDSGVVKAADVASNAYPLAALAARAARAQLVVGILPGEQVAMRAMASPPRVASKFKSAAMYLLEDELAESLESLHIATLRREGGVGIALAVKQSIMDAWGDLFAEIGVSPDLMTADFALLQEADENIIIFEPARLICAIGNHGFSAHRALAEPLVAQLIADEEIQDIIAYGNPDMERFETGGKDITWRGGGDNISLFQFFAQRAARNDAPNLLQGAYRKRRDWRGGLAPWRHAAMLAAASVVALIGVTVTDGLRSARLAARLNDASLELHRTAFPEAANVNPREYARRVLASETASLGFLPLTAEFAESVGDSALIQINRIRYNTARGEFSVNLSFTDINDLEALKADLAVRGVEVSETGGVRRSGGRYIGELQVSAL